MDVLVKVQIDILKCAKDGSANEIDVINRLAPFYGKDLFDVHRLIEDLATQKYFEPLGNDSNPTLKLTNKGILAIYRYDEFVLQQKKFEEDNNKKFKLSQIIALLAVIANILQIFLR